MNKVRDTVFFSTIDISYYDWCIIKKGGLGEIDVAQIIIGHVNNSEKE